MLFIEIVDILKAIRKKALRCGGRGKREFSNL